MTEYTDEDGNTVEAFTQAEVDAKLNEAMEASKVETGKQIGELQTKLDAIEQEKVDLQKGKNVDDKEMNFGKVREMLKIKDTEIEKLTNQMTELLTGVDTKLNEKKLNDLISGLSKGDIELEKKIKYHYNNYIVKPEDDTPEKVEEAFNKRLESAYTLATGTAPTSPLSGGIISSGGGFVPPQKTGAKTKLSEEAKGVGKNMGITDEDFDNASKKGLI